MGSSPFGERHEWAMRELCEMITKKGDRIGSRPIKSITPRGADKIYDRLTLGSKGPTLRTAEKIVLLCRKAWRVTGIDACPKRTAMSRPLSALNPRTNH